ncbi:hypothetical protein LQ384_10005 [Rhodococcus rhodochrous]|uniref:STAS domain-containing protein n=1 Tax=Rhodococcus rhodochrous TaxID=1829 RepID=A0AAW4XEF3_RHORH|nr:hypothetical protein [Rhodococcus rhodochrous]MCD2111427.1 hypothetical protein [Rhodococcus rhodochrous]
MDIRVRPGGSLDGNGAITGASVSADPDVISIDISAAAFVDPFGLVTLAAVTEEATRSGLGVNVSWPRGTDLRRYLARMHVADALGSLGVTCQLPEVNENPSGDRFLELTRFEGSDRGSELAEKVYNILSVDDLDDAKTLYSCVSEAIGNVTEHSEVGGGWAALQQYRREGRNEVVFAVADSGVGLRRTLSRHHSVNDDAQAVRLAAQFGISGTGDQARGRGIAGIAEKARERGGYMRLWSGRAEGLTGAPKGFLRVKRAVTYPGTVLSATLSYN